MLKAVSWSDYKMSGCINCGCDYCYGGNVSGGGTTDVTCAECGTKFVLLSDGLMKSSIGYGTDKKDEKGETIFEYPLLEEHPRKGIAKHEFVNPDVRPENGIGDFCSPRGVGYDLACFVKSKEAGQRITDMINNVNKEYKNKGFSCWLDYREQEPLWIQVKISYPDKLRASILAQLIKENDYVITEQQVRQAMDMKIDFANYWKYEARYYVYNAVEKSFMHGIAVKPNEITKEEREAAYKETWQNNNHLDQFEVWGAYKQIELEIVKGNIENAVALVRHLIDLDNDYFNHELRVQRNRENRDYISNLRRSYYDKLVELVNRYYEQSKQPQRITDNLEWRDYWTIRENAKIERDMRPNFVADWQKIVPMIFGVTDLEAIKLSTMRDDKKTAEELEREKILLNKYPNLYAMFSLLGLYAYVSRQLEENSYDNLVLAIKHIADQINSPLFSKLHGQINTNDEHYLKTQAVYFEIANMVAKYYHEEPVTEKPDMQITKHPISKQDK